MWWYAYGWWWWWIIFVVIFFLLPMGYGWGYRGWGPWYRRRLPERADAGGWGWIAGLVWVALIVAILWLIAAWGFAYY